MRDNAGEGDRKRCNKLITKKIVCVLKNEENSNKIIMMMMMFLRLEVDDNDI